MLTPRKAIRAKCLDCCCGSANEVRLCPVQKCPLYPHRFGKRPVGYLDTAQEPFTVDCTDSSTFDDAEYAEKETLA